MDAVRMWQALRILRWLCWLGAIGVWWYISVNRASIVDQFDHPPLWLEFVMFGVVFLPVAVGFAEMRMREKAGVEKPRFGSLSLSSGSPPSRPAA